MTPEEIEKRQNEIKYLMENFMINEENAIKMLEAGFNMAGGFSEMEQYIKATIDNITNQYITRYTKEVDDLMSHKD